MNLPITQDIFNALKEYIKGNLKFTKSLNIDSEIDLKELYDEKQIGWYYQISISFIIDSKTKIVYKQNTSIILSEDENQINILLEEYSNKLNNWIITDLLSQGLYTYYTKAKDSNISDSITLINLNHNNN